MYQTRISSLFTIDRSRRVRIRDLDVVMNGYRDDDLVNRMKTLLNSGGDFECRSAGPFYYLVSSLCREYRKMMDSLGR